MALLNYEAAPRVIIYGPRAFIRYFPWFQLMYVYFNKSAEACASNFFALT